MGPMATPSAFNPAQTPMAWPLSFSGNTLVIVESVLGMIIASAAPMKTRQKISWVGLPENAAPRLARPKTTNPAVSIFPRPILSPRPPEVIMREPESIVYTLTIHNSCELVAPSCFWIVGKATFITVISRIQTRTLIEMVISVHHLSRYMRAAKVSFVVVNFSAN